jgi:hypothetical protein
MNVVQVPEDKDAKPRRSFEQMIKEWVKVTHHSKRLAREISEMALKHFFEHGNTARCQQFLDAIEGEAGKNYVRRAAYVLWLKEHAPITMDGKKLVKDKAREFDSELLEKALETPFYDFAPDKEDVFFKADNVVKDLKAVIAKYNRERYKPKDDTATEKVAEAHKLIATL